MKDLEPPPEGTGQEEIRPGLPESFFREKKQA